MRKKAMNWDAEDYKYMTVSLHGKVLFANNLDCDGDRYFSKKQFEKLFGRILTEEDRAVEEMKQYCEYPGSWKSTYEGFARDLVKAGYHK